MEAALVQTDGRTDGQTDVRNVTGAFRGYEKALRAVCKCIKSIKYSCIPIYSSKLSFYTSYDIQKRLL
jgi:hypothetical protein